MSELDGCYVSEMVLSSVQNDLARNELMDLIKVKAPGEVQRYGSKGKYNRNQRVS